MLSIVNWSRFDGNPVLSPQESYDINGVADPFVIEVEGRLWLLYEGFGKNGRKTINAAVSNNGKDFSRINGNPIFQQYNHHSYPAIFRHEGYVYMTPEHLSHNVSLWKTPVDKFPHGWDFVWDLPLNTQIVDPTIFKKKDVFYLIVGVRQNASTSHYYNKILASHNIEDDKGWKEVSDIYPIDPASNSRSERSAFVMEIDEGYLMYYQADEEYAPDGYVNGGIKGDRIHGGVLYQLSGEQFKFERFDDNPILTPEGDSWERYEVHSLCPVRREHEIYGYYDGHNGNQWSGIGLLIGSRNNYNE